MGPQARGGRAPNLNEGSSVWQDDANGRVGAAPSTAQRKAGCPGMEQIEVLPGRWRTSAVRRPWCGRVRIHEKPTERILLASSANQDGEPRLS